MPSSLRLGMALPLLLLLEACGTPPADEAEPAEPLPPNSPAARPALSYAVEAAPDPPPAPAKPPAEPPEARGPTPRSEVSQAPRPVPADLPIGPPDAPLPKIAELPLPTDTLWVAPDLRAAAEAAPDAGSALPVAPPPPSIRNPRVADDPACDCTSLICPVPMEACSFLQPPDPTLDAGKGLLDPELAIPTAAAPASNKKLASSPQ